MIYSWVRQYYYYLSNLLVFLYPWHPFLVPYWTFINTEFLVKHLKRSFTEISVIRDFHHQKIHVESNLQHFNSIINALITEPRVNSVYHLCDICFYFKNLLSTFFLRLPLLFFNCSCLRASLIRFNMTTKFSTSSIHLFKIS